jgi:hypothetical protein
VLEIISIVIAVTLYFEFDIVRKEDIPQILIWLFELLQVTYWALSEIISDLYGYFE